MQKRIIDHQLIWISKIWKTFNYIRIWVVEPEDFSNMNGNYKFIIYFIKNWTKSKDTFCIEHNYPDYATAECAMDHFMENNFRLKVNEQCND